MSQHFPAMAGEYGREFLPSSLRSLAATRVAFVASSWIYALSIHYAHTTYLRSTWDYYGFTYRALGFQELSLACILITCVALLMPRILSRPSSIVLLMLFVVVYVPTVVISLGLDTDRVHRYGPSLCVLGFAFSIACVTSRLRISTTEKPTYIPGNGFVWVMSILWGICVVALVTRYSSVMTIVALDNIYEQRATARRLGSGMGYVLSYFSIVISPALIALGLVRGRVLPFAMGTVGCLIVFMITAQRTVVLLPLALLILHYLMSRVTVFPRTTSFLVLGLGVVVTLSTAFYLDSAAANATSLFLVFRTLGLPGLTFSQYLDLFSTDGFTWWSHVKGLGTFIPVPSSFSGDPSWPALGNIVGDRIYNNVAINANANLFSGDGVAAAGPVGVAAIGLLLAIWLRALDCAAVGWHRQFVLLAMLPLAVSLTNGHFFTNMLSFGGILWLIVFHFHKPRP